MPSHYPDVTKSESARIARPLDKVGMSNIEVPVRLEVPGFGQQMCPAQADAYVSLDEASAKGIHMSRLFLSLQRRMEKDVVSADLIKEILDDFVESHSDISQSSYVCLRFELPMQRTALLSGQKGWRSYPVKISAKREGSHYELEYSVMIQYSSTCPCSAALSRQLIQKNFADQYSQVDSVSTSEMLDWLGRESSIMATPHGQRSHAHVTVVPADSTLNLIQLIDQCEAALATPVQAAVKREDEQEFARLNGTNLMFAEDACRKLAHAVSEMSFVEDYRVEARHLESLHAHDAVAITTAGKRLQAHQSW